MRVPGESDYDRSGVRAQHLPEKCRERNQPLYALFVDFTEVSDSVSHEALWTVFGDGGRGISEQQVSLTVRTIVGTLTSEERCPPVSPRCSKLLHRPSSSRGHILTLVRIIR
ncbi:hypothetical protein EG68_02871 [Paragonimus skrjabini miyazakii]|uniref:Uncharacterized protein n=1 Tax=Paragonimus skrjabini miyazakii TaxID=59628 RepID=A0A8S9YWE4_9TREM|nr:hypothetical protein EG68_02871 [Paragonimus skrjabini miyazakii]